MDWTIKGSYFTIEKAQQSVLDLLESGYPKNAITIFCNDKQASAFFELEVTIETGLSPLEAEESGFWEKAKIFFGDDDITPKNAQHYREELAQGHIVVAYHDNPVYIENTPITNEEILLDRPLDISEETKRFHNQEDFLS